MSPNTPGIALERHVNTRPSRLGSLRFQLRVSIKWKRFVNPSRNCECKMKVLQMKSHIHVSQVVLILFWSYKLPKYDESSGKSVRAKAGSLVAKAPWKDLWKHHASTMKYTLYNPFEHRSKVFLLVASGSNRVRSAEPSACNRMCPCMCFKRVSMGARVGSKSVLLNAVSVPAWRIIAGETC